MHAVVRVIDAEPIGAISPRLYGHFAEHLDRCCYDGLWVGRNSPIPNEGGFRSDVLAALRAMPCPLLRWPGGCYADHYHWRDGIGANRPVRLGMSCGQKVLDNNSLGTHEFLDYCEAIQAEPYLAGNMGSGSVQELCAWVEYVNCELPTSLVQERKANGRAEPWPVQLWGVGNENWGCGGEYHPESYGLEYRRYAGMIKHVDPAAELVVCGFDRGWNERLAKTLTGKWGLVDHFSIHRYWTTGGPGVGFTEAQYYQLLLEAEGTEGFVQETKKILHEAGAAHVGIALDEWGVWHPEARNWGPDAAAKPGGSFVQPCTLRDALAAAIALEGFHRQCTSLSMTNLAQIVNVLHAPIRTEGEAMWLTPTYFLLQMHAPHLGATALRTEVEVGEAAPGLPAVGATASRSATGLSISFTNRHRHEPVEISVPLKGRVSAARLLGGGDPSLENSAADPDLILPNALHTGWDGNEKLIFTLPPHSMATVTVSA